MVDTDNKAQSQTLVEVFERPIVHLFERPEDGSKTWGEAIMQKMVDVKDKPQQASSQGVNIGLKSQPFDMAAAIAFKNQNPHHSTCIEAKTRAMVGMGFKSSKKPKPNALGMEPEDDDDDKVGDELDPLCDSTFHEVLQSVCEDYWQVGNGYMEIVRENGSITGIHHVPAASVEICIEDVTYRKHFIVGGRGEGVGPIVMAPFGELDDFISRVNGQEISNNLDAAEVAVPNDHGIEDSGAKDSYFGYGTPSMRSEIIHFSRRTSMSRWYGYPDWLSAVASIELLQCMTQERYDFFLNRGVPEFILAVTGAKIPKPEWDAIKLALQSTMGQGNQHKTVAMNIDKEGVEVVVHKLAMEGSGSEGAFNLMNEALGLAIVTAHRVPPLLACIQIPGKLGAVNELPNALLAFQALVIGPEQVTFQNILGSTLGNRKLNGGLSLRKKDFKLKKITEEIPLGMGAQTGGQGAGKGAAEDAAGAGMKALDTQSRMRTPVASAAKRDPAKGVKT